MNVHYQEEMKPYLFQSAEIRWFLPSSTDWKSALDWFIGDESKKTDKNTVHSAEKTLFLNNIKSEELRTDEYLIIPQCTSVGIKQRQGNLEVKAQIGTSEKYLEGFISGEINYWSKWSFQPSETNLDFLKKDLRISGEWQKINKVRYLLNLSNSENTIREVSPKEQLESGCQIELAKVWEEGNSRIWLSFGFEAFGDSFQNMNNLLKDSIQFFLLKRKNSFMKLSSNNSMSYPEWLQLVSPNTI